MQNTLPLAAMLKLCLVWDANPVPQNLLRCRTVLKCCLGVKSVRPSRTACHNRFQASVQCSLTFLPVVETSYQA